jgi:dipeptidyl aminopeptidase/acylaminoacyl peptidase
VIGWEPNGDRILFYESKGTGTALFAADVAAGTVRELDYQDAVVNNVNMTKMVGGGYKVALIMQKSDLPPEAYVVQPGNTFKQISHANADLAKMPIGKTEVIKWKSTDGRDIEGLLTYPVGYVAGTKVPFILNIHGGPAGVFQQNYIGGRGSYPIATFSQRGYAILRPNPRGSSGYGTEFRRANIKDWGGGDYQDLMTGVDKVIAMGVADPDHLGVMGWSYGGYMTSTIITKTHRLQGCVGRCTCHESDELYDDRRYSGIRSGLLRRELLGSAGCLCEALGDVQYQRRDDSDFDPAWRGRCSRSDLARIRIVQRTQSARRANSHDRPAAHAARSE